MPSKILECRNILLTYICFYIFSDLPSKVSLAATFDDLPPTIPPTTTGTYAATKAMTPGSTTKQRARTTDKSTKKSTSPIKNTLKSPENLTQSQQIECPKDVEAPFTLFPIPCTTNKECKREGANQICCKLFGNKRCVEGKNVQPKEPRHERKYFYVLVFKVKNNWFVMWFLKQKSNVRQVIA